MAFAMARVGCTPPPAPDPRIEPETRMISVQGKFNIILITVDTLRADHLDAYGYERTTAPEITSLAKEGILYRNALAQAPWTLPSMASLITSLSPSEHGAVHAKTRLSGKHRTLAEALRESGYSTVGLVTNEFCGTKHGFAQGFDTFRVIPMRSEKTVTSERLVQDTLEILEGGVDGPLFLWVHFTDPHYGYIRHREYGFASELVKEAPPDVLDRTLSAKLLNRRIRELESSPGFLSYLVAVYDEEIAYTDYWIGRLLKRIGEMGLAQNSIIVLTADHGEFFLERGRLFHDGDLTFELVQVPLIIGGSISPKFRGTVVDRDVDISSIPRTIMESMGVEGHGFGGENLLAPPTGQTDGRFLYTEGSWCWQEDGRKAGVVHDGWKLIHNLDEDTYELYHSALDRDERTDLWSNATDPHVSAMRQLLLEKLRGFPAGTDHPDSVMELDEETTARLEALGYFVSP